MDLFSKLAIVSASICAIAGTANAAVIVIGESRAQDCYQAAEHARATPSNIATCQAALSNDPITFHERTATHVNLGILYFYRSQYDMALTSFARARELDPTEPEAVLNTAITYLRQDEAGTRALPLFDTALEMGTRKPALAYYGRGLAHELNGDLTAAYLDIRRASEADPNWDVPANDLRRFIVQTGG